MKTYSSYKDADTPWLSHIPAHWELDLIGRRFFERKDKVSDEDYAALSVTKKGILPQLETVAISKHRGQPFCP
jgi:type I restriction enzyme S subunit